MPDETIEEIPIAVQEAAIEEAAIAEVEQATARVPYVFPFTLGADPEFTVMSGTRPLRANEMLKTFIKDAESATTDGFNFPTGNIGWDGHNATGEVRPKPGDPSEVAGNIGSLYREALSRMPFVSFTTLTVAHPTGGHIHLSIPKELNNMASSQTPKFKAMQRALASFILLILIGENKLSSEARRISSSYGNLMDFRVEPKFQHEDGTPGYTLEVRGLNAEWTTSRDIAVGTLAFMAIAWDSVLKGGTFLSPIADILFKTKQQAEDSVTPFLANFMNLQRMHIAKMRRFVRSHPAYQDYKNELELILSPDRVMAEKRAFHFDISEGWGIGINSKDIKVKDFMKDKEINEMTNKFPEDVIRRVSQFSWNEDLNVQFFATALAKRCVSLGWKPQHEYFLFGMKKGLDAIVIRNEQGQFIAGQEILKTQTDMQHLQSKFDRLVPKAAPAYGSVLNSRSGELASATDMQRVMVGIPYGMRQAGDTKELLRLILKFEKTPGAFPAIDLKSLPVGKGEVETLLKEMVSNESQVEKAFGKGDNLVSYSVESVNERRELAESDALISGTEAPLIRRMSDAMFEYAVQTFNRMFGEGQTARLGFQETVENSLGNLRVLPTVGGIVQAGMDEINRLTDSTEITRHIEASPIMTAWLVLFGLGQRGQCSVAPMRDNLRHTFRYESGDFWVENPQHDNVVNHGDYNIFADLFGISHPQSRANLLLWMMDHPGTNMRMMLSGDRVSEIGGIFISGADVYVNPDRELPQVWA